MLGSKVYYADDDDDVHIINLLCFVHFVSTKDHCLCVTTIAFNAFVKQKFYAFCE